MLTFVPHQFSPSRIVAEAWYKKQMPFLPDERFPISLRTFPFLN